MNWQILSMLLYIILAPFLGGLLQGCDRKITARMQGRQGPPLLQPFYDIFKLFHKQSIIVNRIQDFLVVGFLLFTVFTGALFFWGGDLLLVFFALTLAEIFFIMSASSTNSSFSAMASQRELLQVMAYEPMVLLVAIGFYIGTGTFGVAELVTHNTPAIFYLPGIFAGFLYILTIKFRKSPFDLSTSHHAHQEMVRGLTTELSGNILGLVEIAHWYENIFLLGVVGLFVVYSPWWSILIGVGVCVIAYFFEILIDNVFPRMKWQNMLKSAWLVTLIAGCTNLMILALVK